MDKELVKNSIKAITIKGAERISEEDPHTYCSFEFFNRKYMRLVKGDFRFCIDTEQGQHDQYPTILLKVEYLEHLKQPVNACTTRAIMNGGKLYNKYRTLEIPLNTFLEEVIQFIDSNSKKILREEPYLEPEEDLHMSPSNIAARLMEYPEDEYDFYDLH